MLFLCGCNTHVVKTENLNIRSAPNKNSKVIGQLHHNDRIKVSPHNDMWGKIEHEQKTGYISMQHIVTTKEDFKDTCEAIGSWIVLFIVGGIGSWGVSKKLKKDGTPDKRYKGNR